MRKLLVGAVSALALSVTPALADFETNADIRVDKDKRVVELIAKIKVVALVVVVADEPEKFAESMALFDQDNRNNEACENCAEKKDNITNSVTFNEGITSVNQAGGNMNNQGTVISVAFDADGENGDNGNGEPSPFSGFAESQASGEQVNYQNTIDSIQILFRDSVITDSVNDNTGLTYVNQATGNMANQANALSVAVSLAPGIALSEADLGQLNAENDVFEFDIIKDSRILRSVNRNDGVTGVNQSSGNMANQANVVSIATAGRP